MVAPEPARPATCCSRPGIPYTAGLLASLPRLTSPFEPHRRVEPIEGQPPDLCRPPPGCAFHPRCREAVAELCDAGEPPFEQEGGRAARCWRWRDIAAVPERALA
jgi:oligopeptide/dipeptide ABC transporter ATP-binding protein